MLSGKQPWSEAQGDAHIILLLAQGQKPRRPDSHAIADQHWNLIQQCWSSVKERPPADSIIIRIREFLSNLEIQGSRGLFISPSTQPNSVSSNNQSSVPLDQVLLDGPNWDSTPSSLSETCQWYSAPSSPPESYVPPSLHRGKPRFLHIYILTEVPTKILIFVTHLLRYLYLYSVVEYIPHPCMKVNQDPIFYIFYSLTRMCPTKIFILVTHLPRCLYIHFLGHGIQNYHAMEYTAVNG